MPTKNPESRRALFCQTMLSLADKLPPHYQDPKWQLKEHAGFLHIKLPHVEAGGLKILEIGPGTGVAMLLLEEYGNEVFGADLGGDSAGYMKGWMLAYSQITVAIGLRVVYHGFEHYLLGDPLPSYWPKFDLIFLRRSVSGVLHSFNRLLYAKCTHKLLSLWNEMLAPSGMVFISHNSGEPQKFFQRAVAASKGPLVVEINTELECQLRKIPT